MHGVSGIVLAGGLGRRMGGVDKGLQLLHGRPMIAHVLARLAPQVDDIVINANQNLERYAAFGHRVVPDEIGGYAGPLAGLHAGLAAVSHPLAVTEILAGWHMDSQALMAALCKSYGTQREAGVDFLPLADRQSASPTEIMTMTSALLKAANLAVFELGMWQSWTGR